MKFKIYKEQLGVLQNAFKDNEHTVIELEVVLDTATQAVYEQQIRNEAFRKGIEHGYKEGYYDGRCPERRPRYCCCNHF